MTPNKKLVSSLDSLAQTYSDRREGDLAILRERAKEIPAFMSAFIDGLATRQVIETPEVAALRVLLGEERIAAYVASTEAFDALALIRSHEANRGVDIREREMEPAPKEITIVGASKRRATAPAPTSPATGATIPSVADVLNKTALAEKPPAGVADLRTGAGAWNYYAALKIVRLAAKANPAFSAKKLERLELALAGATTWKTVVEVARKAGLPVLTAEVAS